MAFAINPPNSPLIDSGGRLRPEWYRFFAQIQKLVGDDAISGLKDAPYVTAGTSNAINNGRVLTGGDGIAVSFGPSDATVSLEPTSITPGSYGAADRLVRITTDQFGRITAADALELNSDYVTEGATNLFFTQARARAALSGISPVDYNVATGEISLGVVTEANGGTGFSSYLAGDLIYAASGSVLARLGIGAANYVLTSTGTFPSWTASTGTSSIARATKPQFTNTIGVGAPAASSGSGITFPATQSPSTDPNTLDDYEEGTWTPTLSASSGTITTVGAVSGIYTKIGRLVIATIDATITTNGTAAGTLRASLPFTAANELTHFGTGRESAVSFAQLVAFSGFSNTNMNILKYDNSYPGADGARIQATISYIS